MFPNNCIDYSARSDGCYHPEGIHLEPEDETQFTTLGEEPLVISYEFIEWINHIPVQLNPTLEREGPLYVRICLYGGNYKCILFWAWHWPSDMQHLRVHNDEVSHCTHIL